MKKEIKIDPAIMYRLIMGVDYDKKDTEGFVLIEDEIVSSDPEDGGADHEIIIKEVKTGKFFKYFYSDWDIDNSDFDEDTLLIDGRCDLSDILYKVKPYTETVIKYK